MGVVKVPSRGPDTARIMVVGEAPGAYEAVEGKPFVGPAGQLLTSCLQSTGIDPDKTYFANLALERPPGNEIKAFHDEFGSPNLTLVEGLTALKKDIERVNPDIIIPVGNYPLRYLTGKGHWGKDGWTGIGDYRGYLLEGTAFCGGRKCLPTFHPAAALRQYPLKHIIRTDLAKALRHARPGPVEYPRKLIVVDPRGLDRDDWTRWLVSPQGTPASTGDFFHQRELDHATPPVVSDPFLTVDIEYIGSKLLCIGFTRHRDVAVVFATNSKADVEWVRNILLSGVPLCFQNGMFDCSILEWFYDIDCFQYLQHDTFYAMHSAYIEMKRDLGFIGSLFTDAPPWWQHINGKFWEEVRDGVRPISEVLPYNGGDVWVTHESMCKLLEDELTDPDVWKTYRHEINLVKPLWEISKLGCPIDVDALATLTVRLEQEAVALNYGISKMNDGVEINVKSPLQVAKFIYDKLSVPKVGARTPGGAWKMDDATLASLQLKCRDERQRTGIRLVRETRERRDLVSKFCEIELDDDGRMRCHYDGAKTVTGRLSSRKFYPTGRGTNLQNVPRDVRVRAVFVPDRGYLFGYADLKSAESFIVAHITGDSEMLRLHSDEYMSGALDGHKYVASFLLDKPIDRITKDERYLGKRVRHAGNYGLSWKRLMDIVNADAQVTGVSIDAAQAKSLITKYRQFHPGLQIWWNDVQSELWRTHTLYTLHRRKRVFYDRPDNVLPDAIAYNPQGTVGDTLNMGLIKVSASEVLRALGVQILLQVHDAIGFQVPESNAERALPLIQTLLDVPIPVNRRGVQPYEIHIPVEIQVGYNWGEFDPKKPDLNPNGLRSWHAPQ